MAAVRGWFVVAVAAWTAFAVLLTVWSGVQHLYEGFHFPWAWEFVITLSNMYTLALMTPALIYLAHAFPPTRRPTVLVLAVYVACLICICGVGLALMSLTGSTFLGKHFTVPSLLEEGAFTFLLYSVVLTIVVAIAQVKIANERATRTL